MSTQQRPTLSKTSPAFRDFIRGILINTCELNIDYVDILTNEDNMVLYRHAFTTKFEHPSNNYELYEFFGDVELAAALVHYVRKKYPILFSKGCYVTAVFSRIKIKYLAHSIFSKLSDEHGFGQWVNPPTEHYLQTHTKEAISYRGKKGKKGGLPGLYEDVFESFVGITHQLIDDQILNGFATSVVRTFVRNIWDSSVIIDFSYKSLFDAKTRLKEEIDYIYIVWNMLTPKGGTLKEESTYDAETETSITSISFHWPAGQKPQDKTSKKLGKEGRRIQLINNFSRIQNQDDNVQEASELALTELRRIELENGLEPKHMPAINQEIESIFY
ncbi:MAG: hypothetical protein JKX76_01145 [Colwellia sp.]|nr:hypothetical protein [Colwellia sp.]